MEGVFDYISGDYLKYPLVGSILKPNFPLKADCDDFDHSIT